VTAFYLLNYAESKNQMLSMCRSVYANLVAGGRFIAYTINPAFTLSKPNCTKYGATVLREEPEEDRYVCEVELSPILRSSSGGTGGAKPRISGRSRKPNSRTLPGTPRRWRRTMSRTMGEAYWHDFHDNCPIIGLVCQK